MPYKRGAFEDIGEFARGAVTFVRTEANPAESVGDVIRMESAQEGLAFLRRKAREDLMHAARARGFHFRQRLAQRWRVRHRDLPQAGDKLTRLGRSTGQLHFSQACWYGSAGLGRAHRAEALKERGTEPILGPNQPEAQGSGCTGSPAV